MVTLIIRGELIGVSALQTTGQGRTGQLQYVVASGSSAACASCAHNKLKFGLEPAHAHLPRSALRLHIVHLHIVGHSFAAVSVTVIAVGTPSPLPGRCRGARNEQ